MAIITNIEMNENEKFKIGDGEGEDEIRIKEEARFFDLRRKADLQETGPSRRTT